MNFNQKKIQAMISHQHQNVDMAMARLDEVAEEEEHIDIKQISHHKESNPNLYHHVLYHPINLKHHPQNNHLNLCLNLYLKLCHKMCHKMFCNAL